MLKQSAVNLAVAIADPTQQNQGTIAIEIFQSAPGVISKDDGVQVLSTSPTIKIEVNVAGANGFARRITFAR